jgi:hypothetical protein
MVLPTDCHLPSKFVSTVAAVCMLAAAGMALAQSGRVTIMHPPDPKQPGIYFGFEDTRGCAERVREPAAEWHTRAPEFFWSGACTEGIREGHGTFKLYEGRLLMVALSGRYAGGFRIGTWTWEFPDGRRLEANFRGDAREPVQRVIESEKGERQLQRLSGGNYRDEPGFAPDPAARTSRPAVQVGGETTRQPARSSEGAAYAAAHFRPANCAGPVRVAPHQDFLATRRDVDRFVREGEAAVREEVASDLATWSRAQFAMNIRMLAYAASPSFMTDSLRERLQAMEDRHRWVTCHQRSGLPYLARMIQAVPACERALMFRLEHVREQGNTRLQAEFADCLHADIHSVRWGR